MTSLKQFIKAVRAAKTIADERTVIQKESAAIRTSFRGDSSDNYVRRQNVAKLLYLFTLGERTHFGQVECLKLLASARFSDKRLGYLGTMLLLDEKQEVLTLLTNSLSNDLAHPNQYVVSLALCTLGNIASTEMARDLFKDIEKIISSSNPYLRKKAAICAMRIIRRAPELDEIYIDKAKMLLNDKNHGVLLCGLALVTDLCVQDPEHIETFLPALPLLIKHLKTLSQSGYSPEHDVTGISDPFLQVKILRLLRIFGTGNAQASERMNDILTQIASNTDASKNVGNSILYEAVQTIFSIETDPALRVLGVNILGKFLTNKDNNTRYVALNTLLQVIDSETTAVQRHRSTIIECLQDGDISIRRRALELSYALINEQNVRVLVRELLSFLETADTEFKAPLTSQIAIAAEKYAPNRRWHIDTIIRMLKIAGSYTKENVLSSFVVLVINSPEFQLYTVQKLYSALKADITQEGLTLAAVWLIGEYGNVLLKGGSYQPEESDPSSASAPSEPVTESDIVDLLDTVVSSSYASETVKEYVINALMKLTTRISSAKEIERIRRILDQFNCDMDEEIQQRVAEYGALFKYDSVRRGVLEKMPAPELHHELSRRYEEEKQKKEAKKYPFKSKGKLNATSTGSSNKSTNKNGSAAANDLLLDLMDDDNNNKNTPSTTTTALANNTDLLSDLFGSSSTPAASTQAQPSTNSKPVNNNILDLFNSPATTNSITTNTTTTTAPVGLASTNTIPSTVNSSNTSNLNISPIEAYNKSGFQVTLEPTNSEAGGMLIMARFHNHGSGNIEGINLQVAVPKSQKLILKGISSNHLGPGETATQQLKVTGNPGSSVKLRLRVNYVLNGSLVQEQVDFNKFPIGL